MLDPFLLPSVGTAQTMDEEENIIIKKNHLCCRVVPMLVFEMRLKNRVTLLFPNTEMGTRVKLPGHCVEGQDREAHLGCKMLFHFQRLARIESCGYPANRCRLHLWSARTGDRK